MKRKRTESQDAEQISRCSVPLAPPAASPPNSSLCSLPTGVVDVILSHFAPSGDPHKLFPETLNFAALHHSLALFNLLNQEWSAAAAAFCARRTVHVAWIDVNAAVTNQSTPPSTGRSANLNFNPSAIDVRLAMRSVVTVHDAAASAASSTTSQSWLTIPTDYDDALQLQASNRVVRSMGSLTIDWAMLLRPRVASLVRLDLSQMPLDCIHLGSVLNAASLNCPHVRVLALPKQTPRYSEDNEAREANLNELYGSLQRWHRANGGLLHLRIPFGRFDENTSVRLLRALIAYCPEIEYLDGWQDTYRRHDDGQASCEVYWPASPSLWTRFWTTCTKLREFSSVVMPFDEAYLWALLVDRKYALESFTLAIDSAKARHNEVQRRNWVSCMVYNMTKLRVLRLEIPVLKSDVWDPAEAVGGNLIAVAALKCPLLRELRIQCADQAVVFDFSEGVIAALIRLTHLDVVELQRLRKLPEGLALNLHRLPSKVRISFASGQLGAWNVLNRLANDNPACERTRPLSMSLTHFEHPSEPRLLNDGIHRSELDRLEDRIRTRTSKNFQLHVHTKPVSTMLATPRSEGTVDLSHLEISCGDSTAYGYFRRCRRFNSQESSWCDASCLSVQGVVEDDG